jgi:hypothetical protein
VRNEYASNSQCKKGKKYYSRVFESGAKILFGIHEDFHSRLTSRRFNTVRFQNESFLGTRLDSTKSLDSLIVILKKCFVVALPVIGHCYIALLLFERDSSSECLCGPFSLLSHYPLYTLLHLSNGCHCSFFLIVSFFVDKASSKSWNGPTFALKRWNTFQHQRPKKFGSVLQWQPHLIFIMTAIAKQVKFNLKLIPFWNVWTTVKIGDMTIVLL